ncbi:DUF1810 domain-containing protein [Mesobaculum littorinae]|uniref:DUF1810 domain-containing protein n=1 Tax=Mesobaculum littorinae TaxID=2486419 RepID=A0A438AHL9_9RHOB|nr:DUF1810 domain-containing protein [Mesobaculum littorinae]RVV98087.1 DUF1810 domain-containing protein [Mesobaculum littorinae]
MPTQDLSRFHEAQADSYDQALSQLRAGAKTGHWMWWIFPQLKGLGRSQTAQHYAIRDGAEARAYLDDPVLGPRLVRAAEAMLAHPDTPPEDILGGIDAMKLRSSMTLFAAQPGADPVFARVLDTFYDGARCAQTQAALE